MERTNDTFINDLERPVLNPEDGEPTGRLRWIERATKDLRSTNMFPGTWHYKEKVLQSEFAIKQHGIIVDYVWRDVPVVQDTTQGKDQ